MSFRRGRPGGGPQGRLKLTVSTASFVEPDGPIVPNVLPNPVVRRQAGFVQPVANLLLTTLAVTATLVARDPLVTQRAKAQLPQQPDVYDSLNVTTLAQQQQAPLKPYVFELPAKPRWTPSVQYLNLNGNTLASQVRPFNNYSVQKAFTRAVTQLEPELNPNTTVFYVPDDNRPRSPLFSPRPQAAKPQQPEYYNLSGTTLRPSGTPLRPPLPPDPVRAAKVKQPDYSANLLTTVYYVPDVNEARQPYHVKRFEIQRREQPPIPVNRLVLGEVVAETYYFLNDSGLASSVIAKRAQPQGEQNRLALTSAPVQPIPFRNEPVNPVRSVKAAQQIAYVNYTVNLPLEFYILNDSALLSMPAQPRVQPHQMPDVLRLLTYVAPTVPYNFYDWQLPKPIKLPTARLDTFQGQNPTFIPPPVIIPPIDQPCGGWEHGREPRHRFYDEYEHHRQRVAKRRHEEMERRREQERIEDEQSREIARLLADQESKDAEREDLKRIQAMADAYAGTRQDIPRSLAATLLKAQEERSRNALEQLSREIERLFEEEEMALLLLLLSDD